MVLLRLGVGTCDITVIVKIQGHKAFSMVQTVYTSSEWTIFKAQRSHPRPERNRAKPERGTTKNTVLPGILSSYSSKSSPEPVSLNFASLSHAPLVDPSLSKPVAFDAITQ